MTIVGCINAVWLFLMHTTSTLHGKRRVSRNQIRLILSCLKPGCQSSSFSMQFKLIFAPVAGLSQGTFSQRAWCSAALFATTYNPQVTAAGLWGFWSSVVQCLWFSVSMRCPGTLLLGLSSLWCLFFTRKRTLAGVVCGWILQGLVWVGRFGNKL